MKDETNRNTLVRAHACVHLAAAPMVKPTAAAVIRRVLGSSCIYQALGLAKGADDKQLHKQYKRVCLIVHPDK